MSEHPISPFSDDAAAYVLGSLSPEETRRFEAALAHDVGLQQEVARYRELMPELALGADAPAAPAGLRSRVIERVRSESQGRAEPSRSGSRRWLAMAAGLAAVGVFAVAWQRARNENQRLSDSIATLEAQLDSSRSELADSRNLLDVLLAPDMRVDMVESTGEAPPVLRLFRDPARGVAIAMTENLAPAPAGRTYQLWFIRDGVPVPSVTFNTDQAGRVAPIRVELPAGAGVITHAAVTEEPSGGSPQPTTTPFMVGALTR